MSDVLGIHNGHAETMQGKRYLVGRGKPDQCQLSTAPVISMTLRSEWHLSSSGSTNAINDWQCCAPGCRARNWAMDCSQQPAS